MIDIILSAIRNRRTLAFRHQGHTYRCVPHSLAVQGTEDLVLVGCLRETQAWREFPLHELSAVTVEEDGAMVAPLQPPPEIAAAGRVVCQAA